MFYFLYKKLNIIELNYNIINLMFYTTILHYYIIKLDYLHNKYIWLCNNNCRVSLCINVQYRLLFNNNSRYVYNEITIKS